MRLPFDLLPPERLLDDEREVDLELEPRLLDDRFTELDLLPDRELPDRFTVPLEPLRELEPERLFACGLLVVRPRFTALPLRVVDRLRGA